MTEAVIHGGVAGFPYSDELHYGRALDVLAVSGGEDERRWQTVADQVLSIGVDLSTSQVSQATVTLLDDDGSLRDGPMFTRRSSLYVGGLSLEIAVRSMGNVAGRPTLSITGRAQGAQRLKRLRGALVRSKISPTRMLAAEANYVGTRFVGEPSPERTQIVRATADPTVGGENESSWTMGERLAKEQGYLWFEAQDCLYFARPTWLLERMPRLTVVWGRERQGNGQLGVPAPSGWTDPAPHRRLHEDEVPLVGPGGGRLVMFHEDGSANYDDGWTWDPDTHLFRRRMEEPAETTPWLLSPPDLRESENDTDNAVTGTLRLTAEAGAKCTPGRGIDLRGVGVYSGLYLVTGLRMDLGGNSPATVEIATPVDPKPEGTQEQRDAAKTAQTEARKEVRDQLDAQMERLRECESGGNYKANTGNGYYGAYQFSLATWRGLGYSGYPHEAPKATQDAAARKLHSQRGWAPWPACSRKLGLR